TVYLIDASGLKLDRRSAAWARFSDAACGAKVHVIYDPDGDRPVYAVVTAANVNDITPAKARPIEPGATYVFDLGYYDYDWWAKLDRAQCRIVTRFKSNTPLVEALPVPPGTAILSDRIGHLPRRRGVRPTTGSIPFRTRRAKCASGSTATRCCASCATISMPAPARSLTSTSAAGRSSCSFAGSSRASRSTAFSAPAKTPYASRSPSP